MKGSLTELVHIDGDEFFMGDDAGNSNERPRSRVRVKPFSIEIHPVTNAQFRRFLEENPKWRKENVSGEWAEESYLNLWDKLDYPDGLDEYAVINVSWFAAAAYAAWAGRRLLTEAEWEFAAGGPEHSRYSHGESFQPEQYAFAFTGDPVGFKVRQHSPNGFGLFDMCGGVWEWTWDYYSVDAYSHMDPTNPVNTTASDRRTLRGGAYTFEDPNYLRCSVRGSNLPAAAHEDYGFRCAANQKK